MKHLSFLFLLIIISPSSMAQRALPEWAHNVFKVEHPNELTYYYFQTDECGIEEADATEVIDGVLIRSRLRPNKVLNGGVISSPNALYLHVALNCADEVIFHTTIYFASIYSPPTFYNRPYGGIATGGKDRALEMIRGGVELAVTDFIQVNFLQVGNEQ